MRSQRPALRPAGRLKLKVYLLLTKHLHLRTGFITRKNRRFLRGDLTGMWGRGGPVVFHRTRGPTSFRHGFLGRRTTPRGTPLPRQGPFVTDGTPNPESTAVPRRSGTGNHRPFGVESPRLPEGHTEGSGEIPSLNTETLLSQSALLRVPRTKGNLLCVIFYVSKFVVQKKITTLDLFLCLRCDILSPFLIGSFDLPSRTLLSCSGD